MLTLIRMGKLKKNLKVENNGCPANPVDMEGFG